MDIRLHAAAPPKPTPGAPCNGCGACCAAGPCPVSRVLLGHRKDACPALSWDNAGCRYYCGVIAAPRAHPRWLPGALQPLFSRLVRRWIAAGIGCDFAADIGETA